MNIQKGSLYLGGGKRDQIAELRDKESRYWAMVSGNVRDEFLRLGTDEEKRIWLLRQTILKRYPKGKEFLNS